jgi:hypothetical protein
MLATQLKIIHSISFSADMNKISLKFFCSDPSRFLADTHTEKQDVSTWAQSAIKHHGDGEDR